MGSVVRICKGPQLVAWRDPERKPSEMLGGMQACREEASVRPARRLGDRRAQGFDRRRAKGMCGRHFSFNDWTAMKSSRTRFTAASNWPFSGSPSRSLRPWSVAGSALSRHFTSGWVTGRGSRERSCTGSRRSCRRATLGVRERLLRCPGTSGPIGAPLGAAVLAAPGRDSEAT